MRRDAALLAAVILLPLLTPSCSDGGGEEVVKVGIILPLTGAKAKFGEIERRSFEMALEEINAAGGIGGKELRFIFEDDTGRPDIARSAAEKLISRDGVGMLGGGYGSSETYALSSVAQQSGVPLLINSAAAVIADALGRAGSLSRDDIRTALSETDMMTVFGPVKFVSYDGKTNQNRLPTYAVQWIDGKLELIWPREHATKEYVYPIDWEEEWE